MVSNHDRAARGELEILPALAPLVLFVWGRSRVVPVRLSDLNVEEEGFGKTASVEPPSNPTGKNVPF